MKNFNISPVVGKDEPSTFIFFKRWLRPFSAAATSECHYFDEELFPLPPPDGLPVVLGQLPPLPLLIGCPFFALWIYLAFVSRRASAAGQAFRKDLYHGESDLSRALGGAIWTLQTANYGHCPGNAVEDDIAYFQRI